MPANFNNTRKVDPVLLFTTPKFCFRSLAWRNPRQCVVFSDANLKDRRSGSVIGTDGPSVGERKQKAGSHVTRVMAALLDTGSPSANNFIGG